MNPEVPNSTPLHLKDQKHAFNIFVIIALLIIIAALAMALIITKQSAPKVEPISLKTPTVIPIQPPTATTEPTDSNLKTYTSSKLGISFRYLENNPTVPIKILVKEVGTKVYIYPDEPNQPDETKKMEAGQFIEVFNKSPQDTLDQAIQKSILQGYDQKDCFVADGSSYIKTAENKSSFIAREISYPKSTDPNDVLNVTPASKCPLNYAQTNGGRYFVTDTKHPDKFAFVSFGQYSINASDTLTWQDTIRFLN